MNLRLFHAILLSAALGCSTGCASSSQEQKPTAQSAQEQREVEPDSPDEAAVLAGTWQGKLDISGASLAIVFHLTRDDNNPSGWEATMDSPDQGATGIPVSEVLFDNGVVQFKVAVAAGLYEGTLSEDNERIEGSWSQGGQRFPLELKRVSAEDTRKASRPQEPKPPYPYAIEEVTFAGGQPTAGTDEPVQLAGTLTLPKTDGPHPAIVLLTGSGPQDRDETIMGHKPFWILADLLSRNGVAVLRFDDRGFAKSTGVFQDATTADFASDAVAAVEFLRTREDIAPNAMGLLGHSEGANVAAIASLLSEEIDFLALLAPTSVPGTQLLARQNALIFEGHGMSAEGAKAYEKSMLKILNKIIAEPLDKPLSKETRKEIRADFNAMIQAMNVEDRKLVNGDDAAALDKILDPMVEQLASSWMRSFLAMKPADSFGRLTIPTLALYGSKDLQVSAAQNAPPLRKHLANNADATIAVLDGLNHLFQPAKTGLLNEYGTIETTLDPALLDTLLDWLEERDLANPSQND